MKDFPNWSKIETIHTLKFLNTPLPLIVGTTPPSSEYEFSERMLPRYNVIEHIVSGEGELMIDGKWQPVKEGQTILISRKSTYSMRTNKNNPFKKIFVAFNVSYLNVMIDEYNVKNGCYDIDCFDSMEMICQLSELPRESSLAYNIATQLHKILMNIAISHTVHKNTNAENIKTELDIMLSKKCSLDELSKKLNISKSNIINTFKKNYGITPYQYAINYKINIAKEYLRTSSLSIKSIANILSFESEHYFSHAFAKKVQMTPTEYREKYSLIRIK